MTSRDTQAQGPQYMVELRMCRKKFVSRPAPPPGVSHISAPLPPSIQSNSDGSGNGCTFSVMAARSFGIRGLLQYTPAP